MMSASRREIQPGSPARRPKSASSTSLQHGSSASASRTSLYHSQSGMEFQRIRSGPGKVRDFSPRSRYIVDDVLQHAPDGDVPKKEPYSFGDPKESPAREDLTAFRTIDISRLNESRHNWSRVDTFQTPAGHLQDTDESVEPIKKEPSPLKTEVLQSLKTSILDPLQVEFRRLRADLKRDVAKMSQDLREESNVVLAHLRADRSQSCETHMQVISEVRRLKTEIDLSELWDVMQDIKRAKPDFSPVIAEIRKLEAHLDPSTVRGDIQNLHGLLKALDFSQVEAKIFDCKNQVDMRSSEVLSALGNLKLDVDPPDFSSIVDEIHKMKSEGDFSAVLNALNERNAEEAAKIIDEVRQVKTDLDFSAILSAINKLDIEPDFTSIIEEIQKVKLEVDFSAVLDAINEVEYSVNNLDAPDLDGIMEEIRKVKPEVDLSSVLDAVNKRNADEEQSSWQKPDVDLTQVIAEVQKLRTDMDFSPVLSAVNSLGTPDSSCIIDEIRKMKTEIDLSLVLDAINKRNAQEECSLPQEPGVNFTKVIAEIEKLRADMDLSPVLSAVSNLETPDLSCIIEEIRKVKSEVDFSLVLDAINKRDTQEERSLRREPDVDFTQVIAEIRKLRADMDFSPVLSAVKNMEVQISRPDYSLIIEEIHNIPQSVGFKSVLTAIDNNKAVLSSAIAVALQNTCDKLLSEFHKTKPEVDTARVIAEVHKIKTEVDFSEVLNEISKMRISMEQQERSVVDNKMQSNKPEVDFSVVLDAIEKKVVDVDFSPVLQAINEKAVTNSVVEEVSLPSGTFTYSSDFDTNGILYALGTAFSSQPYQNPHDMGVVHASCSSNQADRTDGRVHGAGPISQFVGRANVHCCTRHETPNQWMAVDLKTYCIKPNRYALKYGWSASHWELRHWNLEASKDGEEWEVISEHKSDSSMLGAYATASWNITCLDFFRHFRVRQTAPLHGEHHYVICCGIEFWGQLKEVIDVDLSAAPKAVQQREIATDIDFSPVLHAINSKVIDFSEVLQLIKGIGTRMERNYVDLKSCMQFDEVLDAIGKFFEEIFKKLEAVIQAVSNKDASSESSLATKLDKATANGSRSTAGDFTPLMLKLNDIDGNQEQLKIKIDDMDERVVSRIRSAHQEMIIEVQKINNTLAVNSQLVGSRSEVVYGQTSSSADLAVPPQAITSASTVHQQNITLKESHGIESAVQRSSDAVHAQSSSSLSAESSIPQFGTSQAASMTVKEKKKKSKKEKKSRSHQAEIDRFLQQTPTDEEKTRKVAQRSAAFDSLFEACDEDDPEEEAV